jgi:hypothetical protein
MVVAQRRPVLQTQPSSQWSNVRVELQRAEVRMILIVGADVAAMEEAAQTLFRAGHAPLLGEWIAAPLAAAQPTFEDVFTPILERLLDRADAVLRLPGQSGDADALAGLARTRGLRVHFSLEDALAG